MGYFFLGVCAGIIGTGLLFSFIVVSDSPDDNQDNEEDQYNDW